MVAANTLGCGPWQSAKASKQFFQRLPHPENFVRI